MKAGGRAALTVASKVVLMAVCLVDLTAEKMADKMAFQLAETTVYY